MPTGIQCRNRNGSDCARSPESFASEMETRAAADAAPAFPYSAYSAVRLTIETVSYLGLAVTIIAPIVPTVVRIRRAAIPFPLLHASVAIAIPAVAFPLFYSPMAIHIQAAGSVSPIAAVIIIVSYTTYRRG